MSIREKNGSTVKKQLIEVVTAAATELGLPDPAVTLERPADPQFGDYTTNVALISFSNLRDLSTEIAPKSPRELAEAIVHKLQQALPYCVQSVSVAGPGFINFTLTESAKWAKITGFVQSAALANQKGKIALVEYSSPNIAKPFTVGHLRSTVIGDAVANLLESTGYTVWRDNHLGDWGTQFGKQIYALHHLGKGSLEANIAVISKAERPVKALVDLYVEFHQQAEVDPSLVEGGREWFVRLEQGDPEAQRLWQFCVDWSWTEFNAIYQRLGVTFSPQFDGGRGLGEAFFQDKMTVVLEELQQKLGESGSSEYAGAYRQSEGAWLVFFPHDEFPPLMIMKADGSTLYATRDLATDYYRLTALQHKPSLIVNEVGAEQSLYFKQLYRVEEMLGWVTSGQRVHVAHGLYRFKDRKMSTRKGDVIWLEEVLEEAERRATVLAQGATVEATEQSAVASTARSVAMAALKWNDLKRSAKLDVNFDWDEILAMQGNAGPYMLYSSVRAHSILRSVSELAQSTIDSSIDTLLANKVYETYQYTDTERSILSKLFSYSDIVEQAAQEYAPHHLCTYLFELAQLFNTWYAQQKIVVWTVAAPTQLDELTTESQARLTLVAGVERTLAHGLAILGIDTVETM